MKNEARAPIHVNALHIAAGLSAVGPSALSGPRPLGRGDRNRITHGGSVSTHCAKPFNTNRAETPTGSTSVCLKRHILPVKLLSGEWFLTRLIADDPIEFEFVHLFEPYPYARSRCTREDFANIQAEWRSHLRLLRSRSQRGGSHAQAATPELP